jgi:YbbR domain-containing protein
MTLTRLLRHNWPWKAISLLAAILIWILVAREPELSAFRLVPVEFKDLPDDVEIGSAIVESVYLELRGPSGNLSRYGDSGGVAVVFDMSHVRPGVRTFTIGEENVVLPRGLRLIRAIPAQLRFEFERVQSRSVPVEVHFTESLQPGYEVSGYTVSPPSLIVAGPQSEIQRIRSAITDPIDLRAVTGAVELRVHTFVDHPRVRFVTSPDVIVRLTIRRQDKDRKAPSSR